jgi:hypothetical protein
VPREQLSVVFAAMPVSMSARKIQVMMGTNLVFCTLSFVLLVTGEELAMCSGFSHSVLAVSFLKDKELSRTVHDVKALPG